MKKFWFGALLFPLATQAFAQDEDDNPVTPEIYPAQEGSTGVYHVRSAFTLPHPGGAFQGNDHFWGDDNYYSPDGRASRGVETRDCLTVNIEEGIDFNAASIFRSFKFTSDGEGNGPFALMGTAVPSILEAMKLSYIAQDRSFALGIEPFFEMKAVLNDFSYDLAHSPYGARLLATRDFRYDKGWPLRLHGNVGYRHDRSAGVITTSFEGGFELPSLFPADPALNTKQLYELGLPRSPLEAAVGVFRSDQVLVGFAAEWVTPWVTPFVEYSGEFVMGVAPLSSPQRATLGLRLTPRPDYSDLTIDLATDFGISKDAFMPSVEDGTLQAVSVEPDLIFTVGVGWVFGHRETIIAPVTTLQFDLEPELTPESQPLETQIPRSKQPPNTQEIQIGGVLFWVPTSSEVFCSGAQVELCSVKAPSVSVPLLLKASKVGVSTVFSGAGPLGTPLLDKDAKESSLQGKKVKIWQGTTASGTYWVARGTIDGVNVELSLEGVSAKDWAIYSAILIP
jgi:hypothetical protein